MKKAVAGRLLPLLAFVIAGFGAGAASGAEVLPSLNPMLERASAGVVNISVRGTVEMAQNPLFDDPLFRRFFDFPENQRPERRTQSVGSGVVVDAARGHIVTNSHVVENADSVTVTLNDRRELNAEVIGTDEATDIAVLKVAPENLIQLPFGDSERLKIGDFVVAIGNPFGIGQTATLGIVSAVGRSGLGIEGYENFIQTDASINPGNSGGALVNQAGELVGINTAILSRSGGNIGIGFAIPSNLVRQVVGQLVEFGTVRRGRIGVLIQDVTSDLAAAMGLESLNGALISQVAPGSPAESAGLQAGDVVVALNGEPVKTSAGLRNAVGLMRPETEIELTVIRGDKRLTVPLRLGEAEQQAAAAAGERQTGEGPLAGVALSQIPDRHPLHGQVEGVLVQRLQGDSEAATAGLRPGDIVVSANRQPVNTVEALQRIAKGADGDKPLLLQVRRGEGALFVAVG